jgi:hypothetical protein
MEAKKAGPFSLIRLPAAIAKNAKTQVASFHRLGSLARNLRRTRHLPAVMVS